jgi:hypothetical protein
MPMNYGTTAGALKPLNEALLPDIRFQFRGVENDNSMRPFELADLHERLTTFSKLNDCVPESVRGQFETAKNLMLYSWFVFEFHIVGELYAYASLEFALRTRFPDAKKKRKRNGKEVDEPLTFRPLLKLAMEQKVFNAEKLPTWDWAKYKSEWYRKKFNQGDSNDRTADEWLQMVIEYISDFRDTLAHGNPRLYFESSLDHLEICADLINQLFLHQLKNS